MEVLSLNNHTCDTWHLPSPLNAISYILGHPSYESAFSRIHVQKSNISLLLTFSSTLSETYKERGQAMGSHGIGTQRSFHLVPFSTGLNSHPHLVNATTR